MPWYKTAILESQGRTGTSEKKKLTSFLKMVIFFVCFLPPRFLFSSMVVLFHLNDKAAKGLLPQDRPKVELLSC